MTIRELLFARRSAAPEPSQPVNPERRRVITTAMRLGALGAGAITAACATLGLPKRSKAEAQYQDQPRMGQRCSGCVHFEAPNRCSIVEGDIAPHGWSRYYLAKPA